MTDPDPRHRLAYAGDDSFITCYRALLDRPDIEPVLCLTAADDRYTGTVEELGRDRGVKVLHGDPGPAGWAMLDDLGVDLLISAAYGHRIPVDDLAVRTVINVHPSYLPEGRGPNPLLHLAGGEPAGAAGVTVHLVDRNFDTGPILVQERFDDLGTDPSLMDLTLRALATAPVLLNRVLDDLDRHIAGASEQRAGSYWPTIDPQDLIVDLTVADGSTIEAAVRRFSCQGFSLRLDDGSVIPVETAHFTAACHPFEPGRLLGRLRGDYLLGAKGGLVRAMPFCDNA